MKLSILTMITDPDERQDKWREAIECYSDLVDEVVVVNGGAPISIGMLMKFPKIKMVDLYWPYEWNWVELPKHLNAGRAKCTGDWIIKLDIDQFFHENDLGLVRRALKTCPEECDVATFQKMSTTYGGKHFQKGGQPIAFRNKEDIRIGKDAKNKTDLCFAVRVGKYPPEIINGYTLPVGEELKSFKTGISYWNYDYFFKTKEFTKKEFWRFSRAYHRFYGDWAFGDTEEDSFNIFLGMQKGRHDRAPYNTKLEEHPKYIRECVKKLKPEMFGLDGWKL